MSHQPNDEREMARTSPSWTGPRPRSGRPRAGRASLRTTVADRAHLALLDVDGVGPGADVLLQRRLPARHARQKYPWALGRPAREVWAEIWHDIGPRIEPVLRDRRATWDEALLLFLERSGYPEETYHTFSYSPLADDDGADRRDAVRRQRGHRAGIGERRMATLRDLGAGIAGHADRGRGARAAARAARAATRATCRSRSSTCSTTTATRPARRDAATGDRQPVATTRSRWPRRQAARAARRASSSSDLRPGLPTGAWDEPPPQAARGPAAAARARARPCRLPRRRAEPATGRSTRATAASSSCVAGQIAPGLTNARAYEAERRRAEALAELDRAKTASSPTSATSSARR